MFPLADAFDDLWDSVPPAAAAAPEVAPMGTFDDLWDSIPAPPTGLNAASGQIGKGLALGWFDEIQGVESGLQGMIANVLGRGNGQSFTQNYDAKVGQLRGVDDAYEAANPATSMALQLGGAMLPAAITGGVSLATGATAASKGLAPAIARTVFGAGTKGAPTVGQLVGMGAAGGAITGAGEADEGSRTTGALLGGGVGALAAPVLGKTIEIGGRAIADLAADYNMLPTQALRRIAASGAERGSFSPDPTQISALTPEEIVLAKQLKNTPIEKILAARAELETVVPQDVPMFLPEALNSAKVDRNARFVANYEPSMEYSQAAIKARTEGAQGRTSSILDAVSPDRGIYTGASKLTKAADDIILEAESQRSALTKPLYQDAFAQQPLVDSPDLTTLVSKDQVLVRAIKDVKRTANNADLPDNSSELLVKARQEIGDKIESAIKNGNRREAADLTDTYNRLNGILHTNDALKQADEVFAGESGGIDELTSTFLKNLRGMTDDKVNNVGQVFNLPAERIGQLRGTFEKAGKLDEWSAGIRAHMQNVVEGSKDGSNFVSKLTGSTLQKDKLRAALGDEAEDVLSGLALEGRMFEGKNKYFAGSSTAGNLQEASEFQKNVGFIKKLFNKDIGGALQSIFSSDLPDEVAQGLAKIYFDPKSGRKALDRIIPLIEQYARNNAVAGAAGRSAGRVSSLGTGQMFGAGPRPQASQAQTATQGLQADAMSQPLRNQTSGLSPSLNDAASPNTTQAIKPSLISSVLSPTSNRRSTADLLGRVVKTKGGKMNTPEKIAEVEAMIDADPVDAAIYEVESSRNPLAKNPSSSATGAFQLINATAKALGVENPLDIGQNYEGYLKLKAENQARFKTDDPFLTYAAHFLGAPLLDKWQSGKSLTDSEEAIVRELKTKALPRFKKIYERIIKDRSGQVEA